MTNNTIHGFTPTNTCADCGRPVMSSTYKGQPVWRDEKGITNCRCEIEKLPGGTMSLVWAEYHYVDGEEQRLYKRENPNVQEG